jgi:hypothetical protein
MCFAGVLARAQVIIGSSITPGSFVLLKWVEVVGPEMRAHVFTEILELLVIGRGSTRFDDTDSESQDGNLSSAGLNVCRAGTCGLFKRAATASSEITTIERNV